MRTGEFLLISTGVVIFATGGNEQLWFHTDTPPEAVGDGYYLAYQVGAELVDMELVQYLIFKENRNPQLDIYFKTIIWKYWTNWRSLLKERESATRP